MFAEFRPTWLTPDLDLLDDTVGRFVEREETPDTATASPRSCAGSSPRRISAPPSTGAADL
ncbi:hypothetical protein HL658_26580 [Azospirillum sp. RWY-5-1]|uniref:Uncharacterized protein n=1 Tax=Azospirillum oleiclasticum TaxID=2735135 RepID=A0ABX2TIJ5_9PROT|nr:hypothetical protein [Azospirillum oleiclasticum]NYZ16122.1 hypothetical protein [Azospirillum oleiclasticum]NYZ23003.1 hypothetical protein [Azospirillum oleiclasticum]